MESSGDIQKGIIFSLFLRLITIFRFHYLFLFYLFYKLQL